MERSYAGTLSRIENCLPEISCWSLRAAEQPEPLSVCQCGGGADMVHVATALELRCEEFITTNRKRGPLQGGAPEKLAKLGLRIIEAPDTGVIPPHLISPLLLNSGI